MGKVINGRKDWFSEEKDGPSTEGSEVEEKKAVTKTKKQTEDKRRTRKEWGGPRSRIRQRTLQT